MHLEFINSKQNNRLYLCFVLIVPISFLSFLIFENNFVNGFMGLMNNEQTINRLSIFHAYLAKAYRHP